jgi:hypothetical protein
MALTVMGTEIKFTDGKISPKTGAGGDISMYQSTTPIQGEIVEDHHLILEAT